MNLPHLQPFGNCYRRTAIRTVTSRRGLLATRRTCLAIEIRFLHNPRDRHLIYKKVIKTVVKTALKIAQYAFILALPFALFYWLSPFTGDLTIGNDYVMFPIDQQMELQYSIERGSFPLFVPGFAGGGHSTAALTLGQIFHPQSHLSSLYPGYWTGDGLVANTFFRLVALGVAHLVLFILLGRLGLRPEIAFIISFITVYNLRMLDMFRYGASLENYLGYLFLCAAMAFYYLKPSRVMGPAAIILSTYLLITGGHPQMMYLGMLGAGLVWLLIPHSLAAIGPGVTATRQQVLHFYLRAGIFLVVGALLSAAYILPFYFEFIGENATRVGRAYNWSLAYSDSVGGTFNSFFKPLHSVVMNTFGSSALIVVTLALPLATAVQKRIPKVILFVTAAFWVVFLIGLGKYTPVHWVFWKFFPLASVFRIPGRIYMILPFLFLLILAWLLREPDDGVLPRWLPRIPPVFWLLALSAAVYLWYNLHLINRVSPPTHYIPSRIKAYPFGVDTFIFWIGFSTLALTAVYTLLGGRPILRGILGALICLTVIAQGGVQLRYGTWVVAKRSKPTLEARDREKRSKMTYKGAPGYGMESPPIAEQIKESALDPELARFYRKFRAVPSNEAAYRYLATKRRPDEAVVVGGDGEPAADCDGDKSRCGEDRVTLTTSTFNRVVFEVTATESGLFTLSYPYSDRWRAAVDGRAAEARRTNGYLIGVRVPKGKHTVALRYWSAPTVYGMGISCLVLFGAVAFFALRTSRRRVGIPIIAASALALGAGYAAWFHSLYTGDNLETRYTWNSSKFPQADNIAFGRKTRMSSTYSGERPYDYYAGLAVDGDRVKRGFKTGKNKPKPWWEVDLGGIRAVREIVIYGAGNIKPHLPLELQVSNRRTGFKTLKTLDTAPKGAWHIPLNGTKTRFIRLRSSGSGALSFKEVEAFELK